MEIFPEKIGRKFSEIFRKNMNFSGKFSKLTTLGINILAGGSSVPLISERKDDRPALEAPALHTLLLIARQP